jgi:hypothetical protein
MFLKNVGYIVHLPEYRISSNLLLSLRNIFVTAVCNKHVRNGDVLHNLHVLYLL